MFASVAPAGARYADLDASGSAVRRQSHRVRTWRRLQGRGHLRRDRGRLVGGRGHGSVRRSRRSDRRMAGGSLGALGSHRLTRWPAARRLPKWPRSRPVRAPRPGAPRCQQPGPPPEPPRTKRAAATWGAAQAGCTPGCLASVSSRGPLRTSGAKRLAVARRRDTPSKHHSTLDGPASRTAWRFARKSAKTT